MAHAIDPNNPNAQFVPVASQPAAKELETILRQKFTLAAGACSNSDGWFVCVYEPQRVKSFIPATEDEFFDTLARFEPRPWDADENLSPCCAKPLLIVNDYRTACPCGHQFRR